MDRRHWSILCRLVGVEQSPLERMRMMRQAWLLGQGVYGVVALARVR